MKDGAGVAIGSARGAGGAREERGRARAATRGPNHAARTYPQKVGPKVVVHPWCCFPGECLFVAQHKTLGGDDR